ncbi:hypothetical protein I5M27_15860 [Adhaeribacter sp. BT258]|uniref:Uncharacterized protein n=1 Tax=Adhaeribacter terrigena TaxID=2793070 RepID=A0ABS1C538_9BACT|nr:hypothetical protein [Adhaeribacter terrigena]MBK0404475.1 hypothetical protein [Adhaeribacter terrigena]
MPKFSEDPDLFIGEVQTMMAPTRNERAVQVASMLDMAWKSGLISPDQKTRVIKFAKGLQAKKYKAYPHFVNYFGAIGSAVNVHSITGKELDKIMNVIDETYQKEDPKSVETFMATAYRFLDTKALYRTKTNALRVIGGTFSFEYRYGNEVDEPEPVKTVPKPAPKPKAEPKKTAKKTEKKKSNDGWDDWSGWDDAETTAKTEDDGWGTAPEPEVVPEESSMRASYLTEEVPIIKGPAIVIKDADIYMVSQFDSVTIYKTSGVASLLSNKFVGKGGHFDWDINGNPASVELKKYNFDVTKSEFKAEGATLTYNAILEEPIEGVFEYKAKRRVINVDYGYPRFASFTNNAKLKNLGENLAYRGGFSLQGAKIMSAALDNSFSYLVAKYNGERKFKSYSRNYILGDTLISAERAGITIFQEKDSIIHPGMEFKFSRERNLLKMMENNNSALKEIPFLDSYHKMEITADLLIWSLAEPQMVFSIITAKEMVPAQIESADYFSDKRYQQLKGISSFHPLQMLVGYSQRKKTDKFYAIDVAQDVKIKEATLKKSMAAMARLGYIEYNSVTGYIILKPKAIHYVNAHRDKKDFDHISIKSYSGAGKNATLNMASKELVLRGVKQFAFNADSGAIIAVPDSGIVRVRKNRDMEFAGRVTTPNFIFKGSGFKFSYNDYWIDMTKIDSLIFRTKKGKKGAKEKLDIKGADLANAGNAKTAEDRARATADSLALVSAPDDFPEDDSVRIQKLQAAKAAKKLAKQKKKEEKKKAREIAKAKKAKKKKPQLDEWGDPIIEEEAVADETTGEPKPVVKKKPKVSTEKALTGLNGKLYLNKPNNKSGRKKIPGYPMFDASTGAVVYFNKPDVLDGAYDSSVYFTIPPFKLDSISSSSQSAVNFKGTFHSGNIFPPIETRLTVMPDQSLGFEYEMPKEGLALYGGKGKATGKITLNENGLQTNGSINYLTSTLKSDTFTLYLDSVMTKRGISGAIAAGSGNLFPDAEIGHYEMKWHVSADSLALNKPDSLFNEKYMDPIKLYNGQFAYKGRAVITPDGLKGNGMVESNETKIKSPYFNFQGTHFKGNNAVMEIKSDNPDKPALLATDVHMNYDLKKGYAEFSPERVGFASTELPNAQYKTSLSGGKWDFKQKIVTMKEPEGKEDITSSFFYSTNPDQDTLKFYAKSAFYDLNTNTLKAGGVPYIRANDAHIYPGDGNVEITEGADVKVLQNSKIVMDTLNRYHELVQGEIDIMSRREFQGYATLEYKNSQGKAFPIKFGSFTRDSVLVEKGQPYEYVTKAVGEVAEETRMELLPKILYKGAVNLTSNKQLLDFDGEMKLAFGDEAASAWFPYKNTVNPDSIRVTIKNMKTVDDVPLVTGLHVSGNSSKIYNTFVSEKTDETDLSVFEVDGLLSYDKYSREFKLGDESRAYADSYEGNVMLYNDSSKVAKYEGKFNLIKSEKDFKLLTSGSARANLDSNRVNMDAFMAFDINLPAQAWAQMGTMLVDNTSGAPEAVSSGNSALLFKLGEFLGNKGVESYINRTSAGYVSFPKISPKLIHSLVLNEVQLRWSPKTSAWYSVGPISVANIDKTDVNVQMPGHIEIKRNGEYDVVNIYLEANPTTWYYFSYTENTLTVASSDGKFNQILAPKLKPAGTVASTFTPIAGETMDRNQFVMNFRNTYLGGKGEKLVDAPAVQINEDPATEPAEGDGTEVAAGTKKKKAKKKKPKLDEFGEPIEEEPVADVPAEEPAAAAPTDTPTEEAPAEETEAPAKKKKKEKVKAQEEVPADVPVEEAPAEPAEEKPAKKKKEKVKKEAPAEEAPVDEPAIEEAPAEEAPVKKKKKSKKGEDEDPDADMAP